MYPEDKDEVVQLYLDDIIPNRFQPREIFDERALKELAVSIKEHGVIQPIIVRKVNGKYEIIAGERRYKASALAGLTKIPAIIRDLDDKESSKVALLENLQRRNLNPIEEARTYQKILEIDQITQEELAKTMGKSQSAVANKIRLLSLPDTVQDALLKEQISERHARALLNVPDETKQTEMLQKVIDTKMSVRNLEEEIKNTYPKESTKTELNNESSAETIASASSFVNSNPLIPTADLPEDTSNYGKVTIAPPEGEDMPTGTYINYGEIKDEEDEPNPVDLPTSITSVNINDIKENTEDINNNNNRRGAALDSLLNLGNPTSSIPSEDFITPAEKIVKADPFDDISGKSSDYFETPDLSSVEIPSTIVNPMDSNLLSPSSNNNESILNNESDNKKYTLEEATNKIRDLINNLKDGGINVTTDEMDFEKSYQIIIKIDKTQI